MPSTTSNRPPMLMSCDWRQRLGLTVSGASASVLMKLYCCGFQIGLPDWPSIMAEGSGAIRPLRALSKSDVSRSEEHTSELQSLMRISYPVLCLKQKTSITNYETNINHQPIV